VKTEPGLEREILRLLPRIFLLGTVVLGLPSLIARIISWSANGSEAESARLLATIDIYAISFVVLHWTIVFTVALAASIVAIMKGPAYVADAYPLEDSDAPDETRRLSQSERL
jgi:uncharacterized membrane protein